MARLGAAALTLAALARAASGGGSGGSADIQWDAGRSPPLYPSALALGNVTGRNASGKLYYADVPTGVACTLGKSCTDGGMPEERGLCVKSGAGSACWDVCNPGHAPRQYVVGADDDHHLNSGYAGLVAQVRAGENAYVQCPAELEQGDPCPPGESCPGAMGREAGVPEDRGICVVDSGQASDRACWDMCDGSHDPEDYILGTVVGVSNKIKRARGSGVCPGGSWLPWILVALLGLCLLACCAGLLISQRVARRRSRGGERGVVSRGARLEEPGAGFGRMPPYHGRAGLGQDLLEPTPAAAERGLSGGYGERMPTTPERVSSRRDRDRDQGVYEEEEEYRMEEGHEEEEEDRMEDMLPPPEPPRAVQPFKEAPPAAPPPFPPEAPQPGAACPSPIIGGGESRLFSQFSALDVTRDPMAVSRLGSQISQPGNVTQEIGLLGTRIPGLDEPSLLSSMQSVAAPELRPVAVPPMSPFLQGGRQAPPILAGGPGAAAGRPSYHTRAPLSFSAHQPPVTTLGSPPTSVQIAPGRVAAISSPPTSVQIAPGSIGSIGSLGPFAQYARR